MKRHFQTPRIGGDLAIFREKLDILTNRGVLLAIYQTIRAHLLKTVSTFFQTLLEDQYGDEAGVIVEGLSL